MFAVDLEGASYLHMFEMLGFRLRVSSRSCQPFKHKQIIAAVRTLSSHTSLYYLLVKQLLTYLATSLASGSRDAPSRAICSSWAGGGLPVCLINSS